MPRTHKKGRPQPHTFPEQVKPTSKRYRVIGPQRVGEVSKGGIVVLALTESQEKVLLEGGHIEHAPPEVPAKPAYAPVKREVSLKRGQGKADKA